MPHADKPSPVLAAFALGACLTMGGCAESLSRNDFLTAHTGDAVAANKAVHIVDPWNRSAFDTRLRSDGARAGAAMVRYRSGEAAAKPASAPATSGAQ